LKNEVCPNGHTLRHGVGNEITEDELESVPDAGWRLSLSKAEKTPSQSLLPAPSSIMSSDQGRKSRMLMAIHIP
jgi:hypothetical protein